MALEEKVATKLHLPDLQIKGFRGIDELTIPKLGRVTLLTGKNGVGKTTVLEAVQAWAARGRYFTLGSMLAAQEEVRTFTPEAGKTEPIVSGSALYYGRKPEPGCVISIGPSSTEFTLRIEYSSPDGLYDEVDHGGNQAGIPSWADMVVKSTYGHQNVAVVAVLDEDERWVPESFVRDQFRWQHPSQRNPLVAPDKAEFLGPAVIDSDRLAVLWDEVALTAADQRAAAFLQKIDPRVEGVTLVSADIQSVGSTRIPMAKISGQQNRVPLRSLGQGAVRFYVTALAIANAAGGFLLIDEAENGIHHSVQTDYWRMIFAAAKANDVQVLATTHSQDTAEGFARAAIDDESSEGMMYRLERKNGKLRAVDYDENDALIAATRGIEFR